ncbi:hypothetical protein Ais01nite_64490 [Asanoa ishikariensis]|uniref:Cyclic nucleotide-binding domain-containing protein n=1 Tax=Asanoa ishikariensis TaxID=137265 RepID=A0A1H3NTS2_9ACTN|nr:cyclic nucleotide-binding domain-containing protein [Asanoa ishikariensis]GIF68414.1 hypothetical protein Ais01nite_64490 [Asanoa ishikariensis]SDY91549.1 hypothetical protein SAMN05421684_2274 [Asanoa ishikariensis]
MDRGPILDDEQFRRLAGYGAEERVEAGRDLFTSGDLSYDFFLLRTAAVDIVRDTTAIEPERLIYQAGPGDFLGELNLLTGQHVYLTARVPRATHWSSWADRTPPRRWTCARTSPSCSSPIPGTTRTRPPGVR